MSPPFSGGDTATTELPAPGSAEHLRRPGTRPVRWRLPIATLGPAFLAAVAYVDPGNVATNLAAGSRFGTALLWVVVTASAVGILVQYLSSKLGLVTGRNLPEHCRGAMPTPVRLAMWLQAEIVVVMTDLAEIVGGAIALHLLVGLPLPAGAVVMVVATCVVLAGSVRGHGLFRPVVFASLGVVGVGFVYPALISGVGVAEVGAGLVPGLAGAGSAYLAAGIVGATVMPHVVYLHSGLTTGVRSASGRGVRRLLQVSRAEVLAAMLLAAGVNISIMLAGTALGPAGGASIESAHRALAGSAGAVVAALFAVALLASSFASTCVGVYSGQMIMQGFLDRSVSIWLRRAVSVVPALVVLLAGLNPTDALVLSQVVLSFGLPFALGPLIWFTARRASMGEDRNAPATTVVAVVVLGAVIALNVFVLVSSW
ncbi:MAG: manganese transport protein MntH [Modestobacter sp.]|nr:manganese transport protein MntH [Modestobacter sp.]